MSCHHIWNEELKRVEWVDLSYVLGKVDTPDPRHGQPVEPSNKACSGLACTCREMRVPGVGLVMNATGCPVHSANR
jgi:hypothetical protein